ncbi:ATP-binding cassette domain-containing protein [Fibrella aquatilis]|uniref:ABC transporter ATP-binding protein n=1 Tax=Fibrella aquatilis TaxID=2817059 RepID=A0A939JWY6_9BACT|nr:ABC transporter ATP-binding protein [Fibrella aquatilis]MBO0932407.1 ABC transporter ATP-binding protein [Fibrella aquatilis]
MKATPPAIALQAVTKRYQNRPVVDNLSLTIAPGETLVLLGTSGCGKTTTLQLMNRLIDADAGTVLINGVDVQQQLPHDLRRHIGYVIQDAGLFPHYSVAQNIAVVPRLLQWDTARITQRTHELLTLLRLPDTILDRLPDALSGGQRQRVGLARALAADPPIILMDEPFGALDPITRDDIRRELKELEVFRQKTVVLVTHDVREAFILGDRIVLMDAGRIVQTGTPDLFRQQPATPFVSRFLKASGEG